MNGDILTDLDYSALYEYHLSSDALLTIAVYKNDIPVSLGVIDYDEEYKVVKFQEKPCLHFWASMGIYVFAPELWDLIPLETYYGFDTLMQDLLERNEVVKVFPWHGLWLDIGRPEAYEKASDEFQKYRDRFLPTIC